MLTMLFARKLLNIKFYIKFSSFLIILIKFLSLIYIYITIFLFNIEKIYLNSNLIKIYLLNLFLYLKGYIYVYINAILKHANNNFKIT